MRSHFSHVAARAFALVASMVLVCAGFASAELQIKGRYLYDPCGTKIILRGAVDFIYSDGGPELEEIAKTGANHVWWWCTSAETITDSQLDAYVGHAKQLKMIVMIDPWFNGDYSPQKIIDWWTRSDLMPIIEKYKDWLICKSIGEGGDMTDQAWIDVNIQLAKGLRQAGVHLPNIITSGRTGGRDLKMILRDGASIVAADPDSNTGFLMEFYWSPYYEQPSQQGTLEDGMAAIRDASFFIIAHTSGNAYEPGGPQPIRWKVVEQLAQEYSIGSNYWAWQDVGTPQLSMTTNNTFGGLTGWGLEAAVTDQYSIKNTSVKTPFMLNGSCSGVAARFTTSTQSSSMPLTVDFNGSGSSGTSLTYAWNFGDGSTTTPGSNSTISHTYTKAGSFSAKLTVSDGSHSSTDSTTITVIDPSKDPIELSCGKTAVASSEENSQFGGYLPAVNANDYLIGTRWSSNSTDNEWIYVDLGQSMTFGRVILRWEAAYASSYKVQVSNDKQTWTDLASVTNGNGGDDTLAVNGNGRYVRMLGILRATGYGYSLYEFEIYQMPGATSIHPAYQQNSNPAVLGKTTGLIRTFTINGVMLPMSSLSYGRTAHRPAGVIIVQGADQKPQVNYSRR